ncbi:MAG: ExbD/TolR family protein [Myxococcota bacterium]
MAGSYDVEGEEGLNEINVIPLVDIILVLLIIFMVSTEFVQHQLQTSIPPNVPLQLPTAASAQDTEPTLLGLVLTRDGDLFLNGEPTTMARVEARVEELQAAGGPVQALVAADERLSHGRVISLVDQLRVWGVGDVAINTKAQEIE